MKSGRGAESRSPLVRIAPSADDPHVAVAERARQLAAQRAPPRRAARVICRRVTYRGRLAPTPTGDMHVGHARTFVAAWLRAEEACGALVLRIEDLDPLRCRDEWTARAIEDLAWLGVRSSEGPLHRSRRRLAKRHQSLSIRELRERGLSPAEVIARAENDDPRA